MRGQLSRNNPRLRRYLSVNNFHLKETKSDKKADSIKEFRFLNFITYFVEYCESGIKKLIPNVALKSTKKSTKLSLDVRYELGEF